MYYVNEPITLNNGMLSVQCNFFCFNQLRFDYVNTEMEVQIACYASKEDFKTKQPAKLVIPITVDYDHHDYNIDPNLFAWKILIHLENSVFYKSEIRKVYNMDDPNW